MEFLPKRRRQVLVTPEILLLLHYVDRQSGKVTDLPRKRVSRTLGSVLRFLRRIFEDKPNFFVCFIFGTKQHCSAKRHRHAIVVSPACRRPKTTKRPTRSFCAGLSKKRACRRPIAGKPRYFKPCFLILLSHS